MQPKLKVVQAWECTQTELLHELHTEGGRLFQNMERPGKNTQSHFYYYRTLAKEHPLAVYLTCSLNRGVGALSSVSAFNIERVPTFVYVYIEASVRMNLKEQTRVYCVLHMNSHKYVGDL